LLFIKYTNLLFIYLPIILCLLFIFAKEETDQLKRKINVMQEKIYILTKLTHLDEGAEDYKTYDYYVLQNKNKTENIK